MRRRAGGRMSLTVSSCCSGSRRKDITRLPAPMSRRLGVIGAAGLRWRLSGSRRWLTSIGCSPMRRGADGVSRARLAAVGQVGARARPDHRRRARGAVPVRDHELEVLTAPAPLVPRGARDRDTAHAEAPLALSRNGPSSAGPQTPPEHVIQQALSTDRPRLSRSASGDLSH